MKNKFIVLNIFFLGLFVMLSCEKKEESKPECEKNKSGTITISNSSSNPYDIYIDDKFQIRLDGNHISSEILIQKGNDRKLYAERVSGYTLYPTKRTEYSNVVRCSDYSWQIPQKGKEWRDTKI